MSFVPEEKGFFGRLGESVRNTFAPPPDPKEVVRSWTSQIRKEGREVEREKKKAESQIKQHAKSGNVTAAKIVAKEVVNSNRAITRLHVQKAHMLEMEMALKHQLAMVKVAGTMNKSGEVMKVVNDMMATGQLQGTMRDMAKEMMRAGVIEEMVDTAVDGAMETDEDVVDSEVEKVMMEVAGEEIAKLPGVGRANVAPVQPQKTAEEEAAEDALMQQLAAGQMPEVS